MGQHPSPRSLGHSSCPFCKPCMWRLVSANVHNQQGTPGLTWARSVEPTAVAMQRRLLLLSQVVAPVALHIWSSEQGLREGRFSLGAVSHAAVKGHACRVPGGPSLDLRDLRVVDNYTLG